MPDAPAPKQEPVGVTLVMEDRPANALRPGGRVVVARDGKYVVGSWEPLYGLMVLGTIADPMALSIRAAKFWLERR